MIHLVLLSGGSGSRLWPLSNDCRSKQFLKVLRDSDGNPISMIQRVFSQISRIPALVDVTIATGETHRDSIASQIQGEYSLVLEPERRDTAAAIMLACTHLYSEQKASPSDTVVVMPIDAYADQEFYNLVVKMDEAVQAELAELVLLGVEPSSPSEKYGYIVPNNREGEVWQVSRFVEKPDEDTARLLLHEGALWNCGVFAFKLGYILSLARNYCEEDSFTERLSNYSSFPKISFDYEVVEKAASVAVVPYSGMWEDLGTWNTLVGEMTDRASGRTVGVETCENTYVINETGLPLVALGLSDNIIVATPDGILVADAAMSSSIKPYVQQIAETRPMYEKRRWGSYRVVDLSAYADGTKSLTKELTISAGCQISYQTHCHRREIWTIVSGVGEIVLDGEIQEVRAGSVVSIDAGQKHAVRAIENLHIIEVQLGDTLVEEDISRFGDYWDPKG